MVVICAFCNDTGLIKEKRISLFPGTYTVIRREEKCPCSMKKSNNEDENGKPENRTQ